MNNSSSRQKQPGSLQNPLPIVDIAEPCPMKWDALHGDGQKRFCDQCTKHVYDFAEMPTNAVNELINSGQSVCARIQKRSDGTVVTAGTKPARPNRFAYRILAAAAGVLSLISFGGCDRAMDEIIETVFPKNEHHGPEVMGMMVAPPPAVMGKIQLSPEQEATGNGS